MEQANSKHGHRERLRQRYLSDPGSFYDTELLELILTYAIPRRDVQPIAQELLNHYGGVEGVLSASFEDLKTIDGIGEGAAILLLAIARLVEPDANEGQVPQEAKMAKQEAQQPKLFEVEPELGPLFDKPQEPQLRTFAEDEIENSLRFIPAASQFDDVDAFRAFLIENLPYNSISTRQRRASYILNRYFPNGRLDIPIAYFSANCSLEDLKSALFYETLMAEYLVAKVAEELVWPALPIGYVERDEMRRLVLKYMPELGDASLKKVLRSLFSAYTILSVGSENKTFLNVQIHKGTLEGFLYLLAAEYPQPGMYSFESLYNGPMRHWLLWDKEWMRQQLYNLQDFGIITKVSEIDTYKQFTLQFTQMEALKHYFEHPERGVMAIRERED